MFLLRILWVSFILLIFSSGATAQASDKPNVIVIIFDDLNDYTSTLGGHPQSLTPGISRIEELGTTFINAYTSSPKCAPSRTSFLTGKDLAYTQVYNNPTCYPFRDYFDEKYGNEIVYVLPAYLKDSGGYYTYGINKIFHCFDSEYDYDFETEDPCAKELSWNKYSLFFDGEDSEVQETGSAINDGPKSVAWAPVPDEYETKMYDYKAVDSATEFIRNFSQDPSSTCDRPFFMMIGLRKPHLPWYIPEHYFMPDYIENIYRDPFDIPYNFPEGSYPSNGVILPPQPDTANNDYEKLGDVGKYFATYDSTYYAIDLLVNRISPLPEINPYINDDMRLQILIESGNANGVMAYLAAIKFLDEQVNRLMDSLQSYPEVYSNTIIIALSDNAFSLGEKKHWQKGTMWETDLRVPFIIADLRDPNKQIVKSNVSLLDLFPTICDLTETPYPEFPDGRNYFDGSSCLNLMDNPLLEIEKPLLSSYKEQQLECSCFPQFSVRNRRFHYIRYETNGTDGSGCNSDLSVTEEELYELGIDRETDPNEWNNLISNEDYKPVISYLQQWLPDSSMYLKKTFSVKIKTNELNCFEEMTDTLKLSFDINDINGNLIDPPSGYIYLWTNNLTGDSLYGEDVQFAIGNIDEGTIGNNNRIMFYLQMIDSVSGIMKGLDLKYIYIDDENLPASEFETHDNNGLTICVEDYFISGSYTNSWWDFGDGHISYEEIPGPYTYATAGTYLVSNIIQYGNDSCITITERFASVNSNTDNDEPSLLCYPNPANSELTVTVPAPVYFAQIVIYDMTGRLTRSYYYGEEDCFFSAKFDVHDLSPGGYIVVVKSVEGLFQSTFIVVH